MTQQADMRLRKRWITIGPGIVLALILAIQVVVANRQKQAVPPIVQKHVQGRFVPSPEVGYLLERRERLRLDDRQVRALVALRSDWRARSKPLSADLMKAAGAFDSFMKEAGSKATVREIDSHAGSVSELSRELSSLRRIYWERGVQMLNREQRQSVERELSRGYAPKTVTASGGAPL